MSVLNYHVADDLLMCNCTHISLTFVQYDVILIFYHFIIVLYIIMNGDTIALSYPPSEEIEVELCTILSTDRAYLILRISK